MNRSILESTRLWLLMLAAVTLILLDRAGAL